MRRFATIMVCFIVLFIFVGQSFSESPFGAMLSSASLVLIMLLGIGILISSIFR